MTLLNPLALLGLLALSVPIFVHLFGRRVAKRQRFPSLRLLPVAAATPTTRAQPSDVLLLVLRCAVVAAAALALAQPSWTTPRRTRQSMSPARVVVVDTSASMKRLTSDGRSALDLAREMAQTLLDSASEGMVVQTIQPGANVAGAASWLEQRSPMREVVVISDFQHGAVSDGDLVVASGVGISLRRISAAAPSDPRVVHDSAVVVGFDPATGDVEATWQSRRVDSATFPVSVLAAPVDEAQARASIAAAARFVTWATADHSIAFVFPGYNGADELARQLQPLRHAWQGDFLVAVTRHDLFRGSKTAGRTCSRNGTVPLHNAEGVTVAALGAGIDGARFDLVVFSCGEAGSVAGTSLLVAVAAATREDVSFSELDPSVVPDEKLREWERPATERGPGGREDPSSDGRWLWLLAIILLLIEEWLRRRSPRRAVATPVIERQERVA